MPVQDQVKPQSFRSPVAVAIWWLWVLFAVGNLIDLAIQGRDHASLLAAAILIFVTAIVYITAQLPKVLATTDGIIVRNPLREHTIGWGTVDKVDTLDLLRVHCEWPAPDGTAQTKTIHAWAVQHSRRREMSQQVRDARRTRRGTGPGPFRTDNGFGTATAFAGTDQPGSRHQPSVGTAQYAVEVLKNKLDEARQRQPAATAPLSTWRWQAIAALAGSAILLAIVAAI